MDKNLRKKIAVIDGNSWLHRAYHAVPPNIKTADGTPTNAVHGFLNMLSSFIGQEQPDAIVCAFDAGIPEFRLKAISQYKAQRKPMDPELRVQFPIIEEVLASLKIPVIKQDGWEGDDVLGTIAAMATASDMDALLVTGDKDANQLASDHVKIVNMKKGVSDVAILGPDEVFEKYGVKVDQFIDYLALMGDSSDNIPGVPGIGPKSAQGLLEKYGSIEGIYENIDKLKGKQKENIENNKDAAYLSRQAATISCEVPITLDLDMVIFPSFTREDIEETFSKYSLRSGFRTALSYIGETGELVNGGSTGGKAPHGGSTNSSYDGMRSTRTHSVSTSEIQQPDVLEITDDIILEGESALSAADKWLSSKQKIAICQTELLKVQVQASIFDVDDTSANDDNNDCLIIAVSNGQQVAILRGQHALAFLANAAKSSINCKEEKSCHVIAEDSKSIMRLLLMPDTTCQPIISAKDLMQVSFFDIGLAGYVIDSNKSTYNSVDVYAQLFGEIPRDPAAVVDEDKQFGGKRVDKNSKDYVEIKNKNSILRLAQRSVVSHALADVMLKKLEEDNCIKTYWDIEKPLTSVIVLMERCGCKIDQNRMFQLQKEFSGHIEKLKSDIIELAGEEFNVDSPKQLAHILFDVRGLPAKKKTKTGYSTNAEVLEDLAQIDDLPKLVIEYREYAKILSTYVVALPKLVAKDGRIHTTFHQRKTTTGRLSSSDPNIQNIPTRSELGAKIRDCFIPLQKDHVMLCADYSQIELRLLAHLSGDQGLIDAFKSGQDFHTSTAASVFGVDIKDVTKAQRSAAKAVNFGIIYGQQAYGLSQSLKISMAEAKDIIDRYFATYKRVGDYLDEVVQSASEQGYAETMFGRRRYIPELNGPRAVQAFGKRTAMNHPMQGSAADIIKIAMRKVQEVIEDSDIDAVCMMQVHDELDFSVAREDADKLSEIVKREMENAVELRVPLIVDVSVGDNWGEAK